MLVSPCTGVCKIDRTTGWCLGCARTETEIADWSTLPLATRAEVWQAIPKRLNRLGVTCQRLPWDASEIRAFVVRTLREGRGKWVMGVVGAIASFSPAPGRSVGLTQDGNDIVARTLNGAMRVTINDGVRALTFDDPNRVREPRIVLAVIRERGRLPLANGVTDLGPDTQALIENDDGRLFDLGLGRKESRFCVRVDHVCPSHGALLKTKGQAFEEAFGQIAPCLVADNPTRVVETALGRVEVQGMIPRPCEPTPSGPNTHLLPNHLAEKRVLPVGMDLPRAYWPGAIYYPPR